MRILLVDIDHTLAAAARRDHLLEAAYRDKAWDEYHADSAHDNCVPEMVALANTAQMGGWYVIGLTSRPEKWRALTNAWLMKHRVRLDLLLMRAENDWRPAKESKLATYLAYAKHMSSPPESVILIDDQDANVEAFKAVGITVLQAFVRSC